VTGGTHGIGAAMAWRFAQDGLKVITVARHGAKICADLEREESVDALIAILRSERVSVVVHNVGGGGRWGTDVPHDAENDRVWDEVYWKNFVAARKITDALLPGMIEAEFGRVIFVSSICGFEGGHNRPWFTVAKAAQIAYVSEMARNPIYARNGITFNAVAPGPVWIEGTGWARMASERPEEFDQYVEKLPMGRLGRAEEVADLVRFLASPGAGWISGVTIPIDGGESRTLWRDK